MTTVDAVSVVIPCYNAERFLRDTIESVLSQTVGLGEVLVIDDGSTDRSASIASSFGGNVKVLSQPNAGESIARNRGIESAVGNWVGFCDADDLWHPDKLAAQLALADESTTAVCTRTRDWQDWPGGRTLIRDEPEPATWFDSTLAIGTPFQISSLIVRRDRVPRFPPQLQYGEDLYFVLDLLRSNKIERVDEPLTTYRLHRGSQGRARRLIELDRHQVCEEWLHRNRADLGEDEFFRARKIVSGRIDGILGAARQAFWTRDWPALRSCRAYAAKVAIPGLLESMPRKLLPDLAYRAYDWASGRAAKPGSTEPTSG